jgi:hypothetical protein
MDKSTAQIFSKLMKFREEADYNPFSMFTKEDYIAYRREAEHLTAAIREYLENGALSLIPLTIQN